MIKLCKFQSSTSSTESNTQLKLNGTTSEPKSTPVQQESGSTSTSDTDSEDLLHSPDTATIIGVVIAIVVGIIVLLILVNYFESFLLGYHIFF